MMILIGKKLGRKENQKIINLLYFIKNIINSIINKVILSLKIENLIICSDYQIG